MLAFEKSVGAVVFYKTPTGWLFLLLDHGNGYWNFPKGHVEEKETNEDTLRREIEEETGLTEIKILPFFKRRAVYFYQAKGREEVERKAAGRALNIFKMVVFYLVESQKQGVRVSAEHIGFAWLDFKETLEKLKYKSSKNLLQKAQKELEEFFAKKESLG